VRRQFQAMTTSNLFPGMGDGHASLETDGTYTYHDSRIDGPFYFTQHRVWLTSRSDELCTEENNDEGQKRGLPKGDNMVGNRIQ